MYTFVSIYKKAAEINLECYIRSHLAYTYNFGAFYAYCYLSEYDMNYWVTYVVAVYYVHMYVRMHL